MLLAEAIRKLQFLDLSANANSNSDHHRRDEIAEFMGNEVSRILSEQGELEIKYEKLLAHSSANSDCNEAHAIRAMFRESTRRLNDSLKSNPDIAENLEKVVNTRNHICHLLESVKAELQSRGTLHCLDAILEARTFEQREFLELHARMNKLVDEVTVLEDDLKREECELETFTCDVNTCIRDMDNKSQTFQRAADDLLKYLGRKLQATEQMDALAMSQRRDAMNNDATAMVSVAGTQARRAIPIICNQPSATEQLPGRASLAHADTTLENGSNYSIPEAAPGDGRAQPHAALMRTLLRQADDLEQQLLPIPEPRHGTGIGENVWGKYIQQRLRHFLETIEVESIKKAECARKAKPKKRI